MPSKPLQRSPYEKNILRTFFILLYFGIQYNICLKIIIYKENKGLKPFTEYLHVYTYLHMYLHVSCLVVLYMGCHVLVKYSI